MAASDRNEVVVERFIRATPERVYRALTDARELEAWFFTEARTDPRPGGAYRFAWRSTKEPEKAHFRLGKYLELVPGRKVSFEWRGEGEGWKGMSASPLTTVTITLEPADGGTRLRLVHSGWAATDEARELRDSHQDGWTFYMGNLAGVLERGHDDRAARFAQEVRA